MMSYMPNWLRQRAELTPDRLAIKSEQKEYTYRELYTASQRRASFLKHSYSLKKGQHIALLMKNSVDMVITIHACFLIGVRTVLLNTRLSSQEVEWQVQNAEVSFILCDRYYAEIVDSIKTVEILYHDQLEDLPSFEKFEEETEIDLRDVATIMYTSGTTGHPKGVIQTFQNHWSSAIGSTLNLGLQSTDRWLLAVPLYHISGLSILIRSVLYGICIVLHDKFDPVKMNRAIQQDKVTIVSVVTTMLKQMVDALGTDEYPTTFRCMLTGGGPIPRPILEVCVKKGIPVYQTYGMTETASQIVTLSPEYCLKKLGSAGKPLFQCEVRIENSGQSCAPNEEGEIVVKGPNVTEGYWKREEETNKSFVDGWFYTGDLGYKDEDGFLYVLDRRTDLIISGGENIYPAEIEGVMLSHSNVKDAGVVGIEDETWGQIPHAFVVLHDERGDQNILEHCQEYLASYKIPKSITILPELPRNASNKLLRRLLKDSVKGHAQ